MTRLAALIIFPFFDPPSGPDILSRKVVIYIDLAGRGPAWMALGLNGKKRYTFVKIWLFREEQSGHYDTS